eukprot:Gb_33293 [translate_table: standard]
MSHVANLTLPRMIWEISTTSPSLWSLEMFWQLWAKLSPFVSSNAVLIGLQLLFSPVSSNIVLRTACCAVGIGFPVYSTFNAIEKKDHKDQEQWLIYWAVYGCFSFAEVFSDKLLSWYPLYYHTKLSLLIWLQLPFTHGSREIYMRCLKPFLLAHQTILDRIVGRTSSEINNFLEMHQHEIQVVKVPLQKMGMTAYRVIKEIIKSSQSYGGEDDTSREAMESTAPHTD